MPSLLCLKLHCTRLRPIRSASKRGESHRGVCSGSLGKDESTRHIIEGSPGTGVDGGRGGRGMALDWCRLAMRARAVQGAPPHLSLRTHTWMPSRHSRAAARNELAATSMALTA